MHIHVHVYMSMVVDYIAHHLVYNLLLMIIQHFHAQFKSYKQKHYVLNIFSVYP